LDPVDGAWIRRSIVCIFCELKNMTRSPTYRLTLTHLICDLTVCYLLPALKTIPAPAGTSDIEAPNCVLNILLLKVLYKPCQISSNSSAVGDH